MLSLTKIKGITIPFLLFITFYQLPMCQSPMVVSKIYTDYKGWWDSGVTPATIPDTSHLLLGFKIGSTIYSTGVDDAKLTAHSIAFNSQKFVALPVSSSIYPEYIGVGYRYGGSSGNVPPISVNYANPSIYLTDGTQGLDLGTALYNSKGTATYQVPFFNPSSIGDGIPDILITQMGQPSSLTDEFSFLDTNGLVIDSTISVKFSSVGTTGKNRLKFYTLSNNTYNTGLSNTTRDIRIIGYDFSDFGITATNYTKITHFLHKLSGDSDQAFIAYNKASISVLPVEFKDFTAAVDPSANVNLTWSTASEKNNAYFTVDKSKDGQIWEMVTEKEGAGNSSTTNNYEAVDQRPYQGISYYRLSQTDFDGKRKYFPIVRSIDNTFEVSHVIFPNPTENILHIAGYIKPQVIEVIDAQGRILIAKKISIPDDENSIDISPLEQGVYYLKIDTEILKFLKQ